MKKRYLLERFSLTKHGRVEKYLASLKENISLSKKDKQVVEEIEGIIAAKIKFIRKLTALLIFLYLGVYFSFISFFFKDLFLLEQLGALINMLLSIFGTTLFLVGIFIVTKTRELYYGDLYLLTSHIIAIYNNKFTYREQKNAVLDKNDYEVFIDFFRKRGF